MKMYKTKNKNIVILLFTFFLIFSLFSITSKISAEETTIIQDDTFKYTVLDDSTVSLTGVISKTDIVGKDLVIPSEVQGKKVVKIGSRAFVRCNFNSIVIPDTITEIEKSAFYRCPSVQKLMIPNSVKIIGEEAFIGCSSLKEIILPDYMTNLPNGLLSGNSALEKINIPENVTKIGNSTFSNCESLKEIKIPKGVTSIGEGAFWGCTSLTEIDLPEGVNEIGKNAFQGINGLTITIPRSVTEIEYPELVFRNCNPLTIKGYKGTYARAVSRELGCNFIALDASENDKEFEIKFDPDNGDEIVTQKVYEGEELNYAPLTDKGKSIGTTNIYLTKEGYTFVGWYSDTDDITTVYKNDQTYKTDVTYKAKWAHVKGLGAQVKADKSGIRFGTKLYNDGDTILEKGTLMIPTNLIDTMIEKVITFNTKNVAQSIGKVNYEVNEEENYIVYLGTLINIPESQRDTYIRASAYVKYRDKAGNDYIVYTRLGEASVNYLLNDVQ